MSRIILIFFFATLVSASSLAQQRNPFSLSDDLTLKCEAVPQSGTYQFDLSGARFGEQQPADVFAKLSVTYARFSVSETTLSISINTESSPKVKNWTKKEWDNFCNITSNRLRKLTGNAPRRKRK